MGLWDEQHPPTEGVPLTVPIAFHPEPESDDDVDGERTGGAGAADHSNGAGDPEASPDSEPPRRDPLTERILSRGDASVSAVTYDSETDGEQYDLADRQALRRVAGLSTELEDVTEVEYRQLRLERVVLAGLYTSGNAEEAEVSLRELAALAETAGSEVLDGILQRRAHPDPATFLGKGKAAELADLVAAKGADTVIIDGELGPGQRRALEDVVKVKVIDRTALILDIFAQHAQSREGKAQVELAQLEYLLPRLRGWASRCPARPVARWAEREPAWARAAPVRRRSSWTAGASATAWPSCAARSRRWRRAATPSAPTAGATGSLPSRSPGTPTPASPRC